MKIPSCPFDASKWLPAKNCKLICGLTHREFLKLILQDEINIRDDRWIKKARFGEVRKLKDFDYSFNPTITKNVVFELATGRFARDRRDVLWLGPPGTGKFENAADRPDIAATTAKRPDARPHAKPGGPRPVPIAAASSNEPARSDDQSIHRDPQLSSGFDRWLQPPLKIVNIRRSLPWTMDGFESQRRIAGTLQSSFPCF